jgi:hypothetical protein
MKKRVMKKYIPKDTLYCYEVIGIKKDKKGNAVGLKTKPCKNKVFLGIRTYKGVYNDEPYEEKIPTYMCRYTGVTNVDDACFYDSCKCCAVGEPKIPDYLID